MCVCMYVCVCVCVYTCGWVIVILNLNAIEVSTVYTTSIDCFLTIVLLFNNNSYSTSLV